MSRAQQKRSKELDYARMPRDVQRLYDLAIEKEWLGWLNLKAAEVIPPSAARRVPRRLVMPSRLCLTDKAEMLRTDEQPDLPIQAKARLVALGNCARNLHRVRTDAPTATTLASHVLFQHAASWQSDLVQGDVTQGFMQGDLDPKAGAVYLSLPRGGLPGVEPGSLIRLKKSVYGLAEAPRAWWCKLRTALQDAGFVESRLEKATFALRNRKGELCGLCCTHVDDVIFTGFGDVYDRALEKMKRAFTWGSWLVNSFTHCGREVTRDKDGSVRISQEKYVRNLTGVKSRHRGLHVPLTEEEMADGRSVLGTLGWAGKQSRPDLTFAVSTGLSELSQRRRSALRTINAGVKRAQAHNTSLLFPADLDISRSMVLAFSDASFANREDGGSQGGQMICLSSPELLQNRRSPVCLLDWNS